MHFQLKNSRAYTLIFIIQLLLCSWVFHFHVSRGFDATFYNEFDGFKNNYTFNRYIQEPISEKGISHFDFMHYPYGDVVFTADNTPLISIPLRFINHYIYPIGDHGQAIFTFIMILNVVLVSLLFYKLLRLLLPHAPAFILIIAAVCFPWLSDQIMRLPRGHYNLSLSIFTVYAIYLTILYHRRVSAGLPFFGLIVRMILLTWIAFLAHGYYLAILGFYLGAFLGIYHFTDVFFKRDFKKIFIPIGYLLGAFVLSYGLVFLTDPYMSLRQTFAHGIDSGEQKLTLTNLYTTLDSYVMKFPLRIYTNLEWAESYLYLSHFFWVSMLFIVLGILLSHSIRSRFVALHQTAWQNVFFRSLFIVGVLVFFTSLGFTIQGHRKSSSWIGFFGEGSTLDVVLVAGTVLVIGAVSLLLILSKIRSSKGISREQRFNTSFWVLLILVIISILVLFVFKFTGFNIPNLISPFKLVSYVTRAVEQFRSIGRMFWTGYWLLLIWALVVVYYLFKDQKIILRYGVSVALAGVLGLEARDKMLFVQSKSQHENLFSQSHLSTLPVIDSPSSYQALLPLPFFEVGSEDYSVTINDDDTWSRFIMLMSYKYQLPLIPAKLSRTPVSFAHDMMQMLIDHKMPVHMHALLSDQRPILIAVPAKAIEDNEAYRSLVPQDYQSKNNEAYSAQFQLLTHPSVSRLYEKDGTVYFSWDISTSHP